MVGLQTGIDQLGAELVNCADGCVGIWQEQTAGVLPRCLILERADAQGTGCLAVGLNPGTSKQAERAFYVERGITYDSLKVYWQSAIAQIPYYSKARRVIDELGLHGPILWSDLAKCENTEGVKKQTPPLNTLRHCARRFLRRELELAPPDWPILGIGWEAYRTLAYLVPERAVIGIPHPTGAYGPFSWLFENGSMRHDIRARAVAALRVGDPGAVWLGRIKDGGE